MVSMAKNRKPLKTGGSRFTEAPHPVDIRVTNNVYRIQFHFGATIISMKTEVEAQSISRTPDIKSGAPVFVGTRVSVQTMIDYPVGGHPLDEFLDDFPTVRREQAVKLRQRVKEILVGAQKI